MSKHHKRKKDKSSRSSRSQSVASSVLSGTKKHQDDEEEVQQQQLEQGQAAASTRTTEECTYKIKTSKAMGRFMVASRDLTPGSIVLSELPIVVGPCTGCKVQCIGCYKPLHQNEEYAKCKECGWPMCSSSSSEEEESNCPGFNQKYGHTSEECELLKACKSSQTLNYEDFDKLAENFYAIVPLRCLLMKSSNPLQYEKIQNMENHNEIRQKIPHLWNLNQNTVVNKIRNEWGLSTQFSEEEIHSVCGVLEVNSFEIGQHGINIRGLYPTAFLMSHDCVPNTNHSDEEKDYRLTVRASTLIPMNHPITLSYAYTLQNTLKRRQHLLENKFFECCCERCKDPTELSTFASALLCPKCQKGLVLSTNPLDSEASWSCTNKKTTCPGYTITAKSMQLLINRITEEFDSLDCNDIEGMEKFLEKYRNVLHPTHYLNLGAKLSLSQLYGRINNYIIHELPDDLLQRKEDICKEIIKIFNIIEPGFTRLRGVTLYELHAPMMVLTTRQFERQMLSKNELKQRLREVVRYLEEASLILSYEPESSSEGMMGVAAKIALEKIKDWSKILGKM